MNTMDRDGNSYNKTLNDKPTEDQLIVIKDEIKKVVDDIPDEERRNRVKNAVEELMPDDWLNEVSGVIDIQNKISEMSNTFPGLFPFVKLQERLEKSYLSSGLVDDVVAKTQGGIETFVNTSNVLNSLFSNGDNDFKYQEATLYGPSVSVGVGEENIFNTNYVLATMIATHPDGLPENQDEIIPTIENITPKKVTVMKNLYELKGNLTWDELKEKNDEYAIVAKDARLKRDVHNKKHDDEGNLTDGYKTIFNSVVHGTTTSVAETLYLDEDKFLDKVFPPNGILKTANVTDDNGQTVNDDYIRKQNNLPDDAQLTYTKTNWVNRYLNKDTDNNFRYTGNIDVIATWLNEKGKAQSQNITTKDFTISTANKVNSDEIKDNLIRQKTNALEIINRNFDEQYKNAGTDLAKIPVRNINVRRS